MDTPEKHTMIDCPLCFGDGWIIDEKETFTECTMCDGSGFMPKETKPTDEEFTN